MSGGGGDGVTDEELAEFAEAGARILRLERQKEKLNAKLDEVARQRAALKNLYDVEKDELESLWRRKEELRKRKELLRAEVSDQDDKVMALLAEKEDFQEVCKTIAETERAHNVLEFFLDKLAKIRAEARTVGDEINSRRDALKAEKEEIRRLDAEIESSKTTAALLRDEAIAVIRDEVQPSERAVAKARRRAKAVTVELSALEETRALAEAKEKELSELRDRVSGIEAELECQKARAETAERELQEAREETAARRAELEELRARAASVVADAQAARMRAQAAHKQLCEAEEEAARLRAEAERILRDAAALVEGASRAAADVGELGDACASFKRRVDAALAEREKASTSSSTSSSASSSSSSLLLATSTTAP